MAIFYRAVFILLSPQAFIAQPLSSLLSKQGVLYNKMPVLKKKMFFNEKKEEKRLQG